MLLAVALRVAASVVQAAYLPAMLAAGTAWTLAFAVDLVACTPLLLGREPRERGETALPGVATGGGA